MSEKLPDIGIICDRRGNIVPEAEREAIKKQYYLFNRLFSMINISISQLQGYLEFSLKCFNIPSTRENAIKEIENYSNIMNKGVKDVEYKDFAKRMREIGVNREFNLLIVVGLLHLQETNLKMTQKSDFYKFFYQKQLKELTFGKLFKNQESMKILLVDISKSTFCDDIIECNRFSNCVKHFGENTVKKLLTTNKELIHIYDSRYADNVGEMVLWHDVFIRYVEAFRDFWLHLYDHINRELNDNRNDFLFIRKFNRPNKTILKAIQNLDNAIVKANKDNQPDKE